MNRFFVIADIHGELGKLEKVMALITEKAGFSLEKGDELVQLGDKNDRGPDTYGVFEYFRTLRLQYPERVHMLWGNHETMLKDALIGKSDLLWFNGGDETLDSYAKKTGFHGKRSLINSLQVTGHWAFLNEHIYFLETDDYFFCHAPIPKDAYRRLSPGTDFRSDIHTLTWSYCDAEEKEWVDPELIPIEEGGNFQGKSKLCVYGHIHGLYFKHSNGMHSHPRELVIPGVRRYGNAILLDTGCGCADEGYLSCLELPSLKVYTSRGEIIV